MGLYAEADPRATSLSDYFLAPASARDLRFLLYDASTLTLEPLLPDKWPERNTAPVLDPARGPAGEGKRNANIPVRSRHHGEVAL